MNRNGDVKLPCNDGHIPPTLLRVPRPPTLLVIVVGVDFMVGGRAILGVLDDVMCSSTRSITVLVEVFVPKRGQIIIMTIPRGLMHGVAVESRCQRSQGIMCRSRKARVCADNVPVKLRGECTQ